ncbi:MAG: hypothetical protein J6K73_03905 [Clostridia bacterium]|nr:hypothetical protein [Clostridia bacterium]MBP3648910.1 hypothetical protein [Clostridia bacterium]
MDEKKFVAISQQSMPALYRMAYSIVGNRTDAEDAVQQALLNAWKARASARDGLEKAWMMRIVINECYTLLRRRRRCQPSELMDVAVPPADDTGLYDAIHTLPENLRTPFLLKYMEGMQETEVAQTMRLPVSSVKNRLYRARKQLRKVLSEEVEL